MKRTNLNKQSAHARKERTLERIAKENELGNRGNQSHPFVRRSEKIRDKQ